MKMVVLVCVALSGCSLERPSLSNPREVPMYVGVSALTGPDREAVRLAAGEWFTATGVLQTVVLDVYTPVDVQIVYDPTEGRLGEYFHRRDGYEEIRIKRDLKPDMREITLLHELGHAWGLAHDQGILMMPGPVIKCIDSETVRYICSAYACVGQHSTCPLDTRVNGMPVNTDAQ